MTDIPDAGAGFSRRAALIAIALSLFLLTSSSYIAIKLGALPWPIVFSVIMSGSILKLLNRAGATNIHEVNVAQAGASIGGLIAAGIVFTVPGILYLNHTKGLEIAWPDPWVLGLQTLMAGILGVLLSMPMKYTFIDDEELPYPAGTAGAEILKLGKTGGRQLFSIMAIGSAAAAFALLRDLYFPAGLAIAGLATAGIFLSLMPLPLAVAGGYILGLTAGLSWFAGAVIGWLFLVPLLVKNNYSASQAQAVVQNLGMGMVLGAGIGFFISYVIPRLRSIFKPVLQMEKRFLSLYPIISILSMLGLSLSGVPVLAAFIAVLGVWIMVTVAARMTGETNINPLEQFGIFIGLVVAGTYTALMLELSLSASFTIVTFVSVACAVAGDAGHDYKSAHLVGTRFFDVVRVDLIAVVFAAIAAPFVLETIRHGFAEDLFTPAMPAPQARLVAGSIFGFEYPRIFLLGLGIAFLTETANSFLPARYHNKFMIMPMGIGLFLGLGLAIPLALGALIRFHIDRKHAHLYHSGLLIAAGVMGGEGVAGFGAGALVTAGLTQLVASGILLGVFFLIGVSALLLQKRASK